MMSEEAVQFSIDDLMRAEQVVRTAMPPTPQRVWPLLSERIGAEVWVKHENHAPTGAFKVRGGLVYLDNLVRHNPSLTGLITATRGNHGQSIAFAASRHGVQVTIVVPQGNSTEKNAAMRAFGAAVIEHGTDFQAARELAQRMAVEKNLTMVPSFHSYLALGVATYALELFQNSPPLDALYVPVGMGSGICGCILARDLLGLKTKIIGVQSTEAPSYALSFAEGKPVSTVSANTLADGVATRSPDPAAVAMICQGAERIVCVTDDQIKDAIIALWKDTHNLAEGAGAAALAGLLSEKNKQVGKRVGVVLSGGNIDLELFRTWVLV